MKLLISLEELKNFKSTDKIAVECITCKSIFYKLKRVIQRTLSGKYPNFKGLYCSRKCAHPINLLNTNCTNCNLSIIKKIREIKNNKNNFCSQSCAATYNNTHKKFGNRRSKLEQWLEPKLSIEYSKLEILYSNKEAINSELDIYIPSLNLAFELNGIYHYEPIHGQSKLNQIQNNDHRKFQTCLEKGIELCIIDTSQHKYVKDQTNLKYLDIIKNIIDYKLQLVIE